MQIMELLKKNTRLMHIEIMHQQYFQDLLKYRLTIQQYYRELVNLREIYSVLNKKIETNIEENLRNILIDYKIKIEALNNDINYLEEKYKIEYHTTFPSTKNICKFIEISTSLEFLGIVYVFEGSSLGSNILSERIKQTFGFSEYGIKFLNNHLLNPKKKWIDFSNEVNNLSLTSEEIESIIYVAKELFIMLNQLYQEICSIKI